MGGVEFQRGKKEKGGKEEVKIKDFSSFLFPLSNIASGAIFAAFFSFHFFFLSPACFLLLPSTPTALSLFCLLDPALSFSFYNFHRRREGRREKAKVTSLLLLPSPSKNHLLRLLSAKIVSGHAHLIVLFSLSLVTTD